MSHLIIRHFGPIEEVDIELKRVNVIIGPQSSGKSTVLKVACFCNWLERKLACTLNPETFLCRDFLEDALFRFHRLEGFLKPDASYIYYKNDTLWFEFDARQSEGKFGWVTEDKRWNYRRTKIAYVPSERNLVATIPNWFQVSMTHNVILDFMKEWESARQFFSMKSPIMNLPFQYKYNSVDKGDRIVLQDGREMKLENASSGLQSLTPLWIMIQYLTSDFYSSEPNYRNVEYSMAKDNLLKIAESECPVWSAQETNNIIQKMMEPYGTDLYVEEPEAHIFPETQKDFVYSLVSSFNRGYGHSCFITTHSPYVMTSFNNLIYAGERASESNKIAKMVSVRFPKSQTIRYDEVAAYTMENGRMQDIMDAETRLISADAIDDASQIISNDFQFLLDL